MVARVLSSLVGAVVAVGVRCSLCRRAWWVVGFLEVVEEAVNGSRSRIHEPATAASTTLSRTSYHGTRRNAQHPPGHVGHVLAATAADAGAAADARRWRCSWAGTWSGSRSGKYGSEAKEMTRRLFLELGQGLVLCGHYGGGHISI